MNGSTGEVEVQLTRHSYRAGRWEAATCANHLWAEAGRCGLEKAKLMVSVKEGATWIWAMIFLGFAHCSQILDWWQAGQSLWLIAAPALGQGTPATADWVKQPKRLLAQSNLRQVMRNVRRLYPRGNPCPKQSPSLCSISSAIAGACATANSA